MTVDETLRRELLDMAHDDQRARLALAGRGALDDADEWTGLAAVDEPHAARLWEILDDYEQWPGVSLVGEDGAHAAWMLAQHAAADPELQRRCLELLEVAVALDDAPPMHFAYLLDRVRIADGRDQVYGTQFVGCDDGHSIEPWPIEDAAGVDGRRRRLGLPTMELHTQLMQEHYSHAQGA